MVHIFNIEMCSALTHKLENVHLDMGCVYGVRKNNIDMMDGGDIVNSNSYAYPETWSMASFNLKFWNGRKYSCIYIPVFWISWTDQIEYEHIVRKTWDYIHKNIEFFINFM